MRPPHAPVPPPGRLMPACTMARGRRDALFRGHDAGTRFGPPPLADRIVKPQAKRAG